MRYMCLVLLDILMSSSVGGQEYSCEHLCNPVVFDALFYLNDNPDLNGVYTTKDESITHWCNNGVDEGRQGTSTFHSMQYLDRYPDLKETYGDNYADAINHYITLGKSENRIGYLEGGGYSRWTTRSLNTVGGSYVYVSTSERTAGAIDSLVWDDKEFINNYDHGRQLQLALTLPQNGECWNPTEAGGRDDGIGDATFSNLQNISAYENVLTTSNLPAYWLRTGTTATQPSGGNCQVGTEAYNEVNTHQFELSKTVTLGCFGMEHCMEWRVRAALGFGLGQPLTYDYAQLESPTAYCMADFTTAYRWNYETDELVPESVTGEDIWPVIIATSDSNYAIGGYAEDRGDLAISMRYAYFDFGIPNYNAETYKWSVVWRENKEPNDFIEETSWVCVGTLTMVQECLRNVRSALVV